MPAPYLDRQMKAREAVDSGKGQVLIPADWARLSVAHRCSIASQIIGNPITSAEVADAVIHAELLRRG